MAGVDVFEKRDFIWRDQYGEDFEKPIVKKIMKTQPGSKKYSFWTEEQEALLKKQYGRMPRKELARVLGRTVSAISLKALELGLCQKKEPIWSEDQIELLEDKWGVYTLPKLAKKLNRTETAIITKVKKLGLGPSKDNTEYMNAKELSDALGINIHTITDCWIPKYSLKARRKATRKVYKFWRINLDDFWAWAEHNQDRFDSRKFEKGNLGMEPAWMELKRKRDKLLPARRYQKWTSSEEARLISLFKSGSKTYKEIGILLGRSKNAVVNRLRQIGREKIWIGAKTPAGRQSEV